MSVAPGPSSRTTTLSYGSTNPSAAYVASLVDPVGNAASFSYDLAGRLTQETLPVGRTVGLGYDADGHLTSLTPPGRAAYTFVYGADEQLSNYTLPPPTVGAPNPSTQYSYDALGRLVQVNRADAQAIGVTYDLKGRPVRLIEPTGMTEATYNAITGQLQGFWRSGWTCPCL